MLRLNAFVPPRTGDLLSISASAIGLVEHRWHLAARAGRALAAGLATSAAAACAATALVRLFGRVPDDLILADTVLGPSLTKLGPGSILVAIAAGVAGMLAFERAAGAAVGVAISVTTIPAAAYVGDAIALGRTTPMGGALVVGSATSFHRGGQHCDTGVPATPRSQIVT